jgi:AraC family transcriptional regulator
MMVLKEERNNINPAVKQDNESLRVLGAFQSDQFSVSLSEYRKGLRQNWHSHEQPILTLILSGYAREQVGCGDLIASPLKIGLKPAGLRHTDHFWSNGVRALRILFYPSFFSEAGSTLQMMERWDWRTGSQAVRPLLRLARSLPQDETHDTEVTENIYESLAVLLSASPARCTSEPPLWLRYARDHLETSYSSGIRLTHLAREAKVHPVYFARQFRRFFGCSVGEYVRQLQFRATATLLADPQANLAQIAHHVGFSDQAHLTRVFAKEFGVTPGQFHRIVT